MLQVLPCILILENVADFPYEIVAKFLYMYKWEEIVLSIEMFGFDIARTRKYCVLTLVAHYRLEFPLSFITDLLGRKRDPTFTWSASFMAEQSETVAEARALRRRKSCVAYGQEMNISDPHFFEDSLSGCETKHLASFRALHPNHDTLCTLSQNADHRDMSSSGPIGQTLTASAQMIWNDALVPARFATARECLGMQGFPVYDGMVAACFQTPVRPWPCSSFNVSRARCGLGARVRSAMMHQAETVCTALSWVL